VLIERRRQAMRTTRLCSMWCCDVTCGRTLAGRWVASWHRQQLFDTPPFGAAICSRHTADCRLRLHTKGLKSRAVRQACHASTAALWQSRDSDATGWYCAADRLEHMRKVIPALEIAACHASVQSRPQASIPCLTLLRSSRWQSSCKSNDRRRQPKPQPDRTRGARAWRSMCLCQLAALMHAGTPAPSHTPCSAAPTPQVVLEIKGEAQLRTLAERLAEAGVAHKLWVEQPEDFPTCLATAPAHKSAVSSHFKKLKLCKGV